jgi:iron complex outermembrane receptor protein
MPGVTRAPWLPLLLLPLACAPSARAQSSAPPRAAAPAASAASAPTATLDRVDIRGRNDPTSERRLSTAAKIVVGREEIEQFGDTTLGDVLKRLPSVTVGGRPGAGGRIAMRGMGNGYTQILIDGERIPPGFSIDDLSPDQVERIEIYRAPTAETGARAIAGTINIVLREPLRVHGDDVRLTLAEERGRLQPEASWTRNDTLGGNGTYNVTLTGSHGNRLTDTETRTTYTDLATGDVDLSQRTLARQHEDKDSLHLSSRLVWRGAQGDQLMLQPFVVVSRSRSHTDGTLEQFAGTAPAPYATSRTDAHADTALGRLLVQFTRRLAEATRLELRGSIGRFSLDSGSVTDQFDAGGGLALDQRTTTTIGDRSYSLAGKLSHLWAEKHSLVGGFEAEGTNRTENLVTLIDGVPALADFGGDVKASVRRVAAYVQDEWDPSAAWSAHAGLRWEAIRTRSESIGAPADNTGIVLTPLLHAVWRFDAPGRDQLRMSLTRSYRAPSLQSLVAVPRLSTLYPAPGPNTASSPDRAGNPALRPELALGIDVAVEHYLKAGGILSASVFVRRIQDLMRNVTTLEDVSWAVVPRWVSRPQNVGDAVSQGVELEAKFRLDELVEGGAPITLWSNASVYDSRVSGVPGPNNRIDQQPGASVNLGGEYRLRGLPLTFGGNLNWVPAYTVRQTDVQRQSFEATRVLDAYALWVLGPATRVRLSLANALPRHYVTSSTIVDGGQAQTVAADGPTYRVVSLRLEMKL